MSDGRANEGKVAVVGCVPVARVGLQHSNGADPGMRLAIARGATNQRRDRRSVDRHRLDRLNEVIRDARDSNSLIRGRKTVVVGGNGEVSGITAL